MALTGPIKPIGSVNISPRPRWASCSRPSKANRHGHRDWLKGLLIYGHGLRVSEACDQRWDDIDLPKRTVVVRRLKGSTDSVHYLERDELAGLKQLHREQETKSSYVFINECGQAIWAHGHCRMIERASDAAKLPSRCMSTCCATAQAMPCPGWQRHGYAAATALPAPRLNHQHGALYRDES